MRRITTTLTLSLLAAPAVLAEDGTGTMKLPDFQKTDDHQATGAGSVPLGPPKQVLRWSASKTDDHRSTGFQDAEPPIIIDRGWPGDHRATDPDEPDQFPPYVMMASWEAYDLRVDAAGAQLLETAEAGQPGDLEPFRKALRFHAGRLRGHFDVSDGLSTVGGDVIGVQQARDLWARAIDVSIDGRLRSMRVKATSEDFDALRLRLAQRARVLQSERAEAEGLEALLTEAQATGDLHDFELELERQRLVQAYRVARRNLDDSGAVRLVDVMRIHEVRARMRAKGLQPYGPIVYPVR